MLTDNGNLVEDPQRDPNDNYSTSGKGMERGVNFANVCTNHPIGLNSKICWNFIKEYVNQYLTYQLIYL